jgi:hypothetical protein
LGLYIYRRVLWAKAHYNRGIHSNINNTLTPLAVATLSFIDVKTRSKFGENTRRQPLAEDVGELQRGGDTENPNVTGGDTLTDEVQVDLHVLRVSMLHEIGEVDHAGVVVVDEDDTLEGVVELLEKLAQPGGLCHTVGHSAVLGLRAGAGDDELPLGGPGDEFGA